jgi:type I restriction enzyme S subunit
MDAALESVQRESAEPWGLPEGWAWAPLKLLSSFIGRGRGPKYVEAGGVPVVNQKCIRWRKLEPKHFKLTSREAFDRLSPELRIRAGDLLWNSTGSGTIGRALVYDGSIAELTVDSHVTIVRPSSIDPTYLGYFIETSRVQRLVVDGHVGSTNQQELPRSFVEELLVPLAPLAEQRRIVARVDELFAEIAEGEAALEATRKGLDTFRRALLKAAVTGELTKDWRENNTVTETGHDLLARIRAERAAKGQARGRGKRVPDAASLDTSILPELPEDWAWGTLGEIATAGPTNGYSPKKSTDGSGTLALKLTATSQGQIDLSDRATKRLSETIPPDSDLFLKPDDLLFQRGNTIEYVGIAAVYEGPIETYVYPDLMIRVRIEPAIGPGWVWRVANAPFGRKYMSERATGTAGTMPKISGAILRNLPIPIPPPAEATEILRRVSEALAASADTLAMLDAEAADAARLKQSILKAAFEGRLVPQDPADEPASAILAKLNVTPSTADRPRRGRKTREF